MNTHIEQNYFHCYATANESRLYIKDIQNILRIKNCYSGCNKVLLFIAISEVKNISKFDHFFVKTVRRLFHNHPNIELREIYFKSNIGRDFSSFQTLLEKVKKEASVDDFILFQNRSGYGPFRENWYSQFVRQFQKFDSVAICGSTINFNDHPERSKDNNLPHIQTYAFLTKVSYMNMLGDRFPAADKTKKLDIILEGEIALSQFFLEKGYKITCIEWPNDEISSQTAPLSPIDIKHKVTAPHYFYHRLYFRKNIFRKIKQPILGVIDWLKFAYYGLK